MENFSFILRAFGKYVFRMIAFVLLAILLPPIVMLFLGYKVNAHSDELAEEAAQKNDVMLCTKIINYGLLGPSSGESRAHCIKRYAEYTKDPSACELLMPSSYGWSCLGAATDHRLCIIGEGPENTVRGQGKVTTYNECLSGDQEIRNYSCCVMARILTEDNTQDQCQSLASPELRDECHYFLARKTIENAECALIENSTTRTACGVAVRALLNN